MISVPQKSVLPLEHVAVGAATLPRAGGNAGEQATTLESGQFGQSIICPENPQKYHEQMGVSENVVYP